MKTYLKTLIFGIVAASLAVTNLSTFAEAPVTPAVPGEIKIVGTWKVISAKEGDKDVKAGWGAQKIGTLWRIKKDKTCILGGMEGTWTFDAEEKEFKFSQTDFFITHVVIDGTVKAIGNTIRIRWVTLGINCEVILGPED